MTQTMLEHSRARQRAARAQHGALQQSFGKNLLRSSDAGEPEHIGKNTCDLVQ